MGAVYRARQRGLGRDVALKILRRKPQTTRRSPKRFIREAQSLARLSHPQIVTIHDFGETSDLYYLVMGVRRWRHLRQIMEAGCEPSEALAIVPQVCDALALRTRAGHCPPGHQAGEHPGRAATVT